MLIGIPAVFTREHDVILVAEPFVLSVTVGGSAWTKAHSKRVQDAVLRRFFRSARAFADERLNAVLEASCTAEFGYRLTMELSPAVRQDALMVTCPPNAHLALSNFLERTLLFSVETIGRVVRRNSPSLH